jgi:AcrR family transcriptional regulator
MSGSQEARLAISRAAARLFIERGVTETSGEAIAEAAGVSIRTVWRRFRSKENCVEPVLIRSLQRFVRIMEQWPLGTSLEDHLEVALPLDGESPDLIADGVLAIQLIALTVKEPDIRTEWLDAYHFLETQLLAVVARRTNRSTLDFEVRLCAAAIAAAVRIVDQSIGTAALSGDRTYTPADLVTLLSDAIRNAATLPMCDPIDSGIYRLSGNSEPTPGDG